MSLSCAWDEREIDESTWFCKSPEDFSILELKKPQSCCSCQSRINYRDICLEFVRYTYSENGTELIGYILQDCGERINLPPLFMCEECGEQFYNLDALGYCMHITDNMMELLGEYQNEMELSKEENKQ